MNDIKRLQARIEELESRGAPWMWIGMGLIFGFIVGFVAHVEFHDWAQSVGLYPPYRML